MQGRRRDLRRTLAGKREETPVIRITLAILLIAAVGGLVAALLVRFAGEETIAVQVRGELEHVPAGATVAEATTRFSLQPAAGDLLDVEGGVLKRAAYPGGVLLNGRAASRASELREGDRLALIDGRSRREPARRIFVRVAGGMPANPQFTLARAPGAEIERGQVSGKVDPRTVRPSGPWHTPKAVALTFDDGPSVHTGRILAVLSRMHARATFFVVGRSGERYPQLVRREFAAGMEVGNHSYSHPYRPPFDRRSPTEIAEEIQRGRDVVAALARYPTVFRPPGGVFSPNVVEAARQFDQRVVLWSVDAEDWRPRATAKEIVRRVLRDVRPGSIVLLHDGGGDRSQTVKALSRIVRGIRAKGLKLSFVDLPRRP